MDKNTVIAKMEEYVRAYREQLDKNDGSSLSAIAANAVAAFESLKDTVMNNEKARNGVDKFKQCMETFEKSVKKGDKQLSAKAVAMMEEALRDLKKK